MTAYPQESCLSSEQQRSLSNKAQVLSWKHKQGYPVFGFCLLSEKRVIFLSDVFSVVGRTNVVRVFVCGVGRPNLSLDVFSVEGNLEGRGPLRSQSIIATTRQAIDLMSLHRSLVGSLDIE